MATIRTKLKQLRDADVRYISLVDRAATRIPFRVLKRDKENKMGIDLTQVFKSDENAKPFVSALVVFAQPDEVTEQIRAAIEKHGFATDRVQKSDEGETLVYAQADQPKDVQVIRLSDQMLASVAGLTIPSGWMGEFVEQHGFFPDLKTATAALYDQMDTVTKSETPQAEALAALTSYGEYLNEMVVLPSACYQLNDAIQEIVQKCACTEKDEEKDAVTKESEEDEAARKKRIKDHPPSEMAPADEDDDQKPPPDAVEKTEKKPEPKKMDTKKAEPKSDADVILAALKGVEDRTTAKLTSLSQKVEAIVTEQAEHKKVLDGVVEKADTLSTSLRTTVTAVPPQEDRPVGQTRMRVQKDEDPRTGNFDTAFLRRRR